MGILQSLKLTSQKILTLKYLDLRFRFFECKFKIFHIYNLKYKRQNQINLKKKKCQKETVRKTYLALVSKRNHPKKYQVSKRLFIRNKSILTGLF